MKSPRAPIAAKEARGFTLAEVMLVLIIGAVVLGSATVMYAMLRDSASAATANARAAALRAVVERLMSSSSNGLMPSVTLVRQAWTESRPDWGASPWGGTAACAAADANCVNGIRDIRACETDTASRCYQDVTLAGDSGVMVYFHMVRPRRENLIDIWDNNQKLYVHASRYAIAVENPRGRQFYFVNAPPDLDPVTSAIRPPDATSGRGGECGCFEGAVAIEDPYNR